MYSNTETPQKFDRLIYFEKQSDDRLCGMHCINSLLQGPYFDIISLSEIGIELDKKEQSLLGRQNSNHNNVDLSGNYNIQVLTQALNSLGCDVIGLKTHEAISLLDNNQNFEALIFNSSSHWFSIRKINGIWFNLNSTNNYPGPEIISDFYLGAFIQGAEDIGYINFLVKNLPKLPPLNGEFYQNLQNNQRLVSYDEIIQAQNLKKEKRKQRDEEDKRKKEEENKFKPFSGTGHMIDSNYNNMSNNYEFEDDQMREAYELSLLAFAEQLKKEIPPEPKYGGYSFHINVNGKMYNRKFEGKNKIGDIVKYIQSEIPTLNHVLLFQNFPYKSYDNIDLTIEDSGLGFNQMLFGKIIN